MSRPEPKAERQWVLDGIKGLTAIVIVLHHATSYGPVSRAWDTLAPTLTSVLYDYGRMAVQVFLVIAGFLATQNLTRTTGQLSGLQAWHLVQRRYVRLAWPFAVALLLAMALAAISRPHLPDQDWLPQQAHWGQWLAHVGMVHSLMGIESLSAGAWYVSIDFQLFVVLTLVHTAVRPPWVPALVVTLTLASLWWFNLHSAWDNWAWYFMGAYGLGACAAYSRQSTSPMVWRTGIVIAVCVGMAIDMRWRVGLAGVTAWVLASAALNPSAPPYLKTFAGWLGQRSFAVFLVHFPVLMGLNAVWQSVSPSAHLVWAWLAALLLVSWLAAEMMWRWVEQAGPPQIGRRFKTPAP